MPRRSGRWGPGELAVAAATVALLMVAATGDLLWTGYELPDDEAMRDAMRSGTFDPDTAFDGTFRTLDAPTMSFLATQVIRTPLAWGALLLWAVWRQGAPQVVLARTATAASVLALIVLAIRAAIPRDRSTLAVGLHDALGGVPGAPFSLTSLGWVHTAALGLMVVGGAVASGVGGPRPPIGRSGGGTGSVGPDG